MTWSRLQELARIDDAWQRAFYEHACIAGRWSVRQLQRQIGSLLYERTGLSTDRATVIDRARKQEREETIDDIVRDPYVLEFTGLAQRPVYLESDLEGALLEHLQAFLLELGDGFCFEARQKRIRVGDEDDYIDLVFYQRRPRCHVLLDLKVRRFRPADAGSDIRTVQELLGHSDVKTTMIYTHVLNRGPAGVRSPADRLFGE